MLIGYAMVITRKLIHAEEREREEPWDTALDYSTLDCRCWTTSLNLPLLKYSMDTKLASWGERIYPVSWDTVLAVFICRETLQSEMVRFILERGKD